MHARINKPWSRHTGFTLVEIMVGLVIGLLAVLVIMQTYSNFEGQKRTTTSGSDAQTNGALALYSIERDVRMAGYGFGVAGALGCTINTYYDSGSGSGGTPGTITLAPVLITNGANSTPDSIKILASSSSTFSIPATITADHPSTAANFFVNSTAGMQIGDLMVAYEAGKPCSLVQITGPAALAGSSQFIHNSGQSPWNAPGGNASNPIVLASGYDKGATLFDFGSMSMRTYSIDTTNNDGGLQLTTFNSSSNTSTTVTIVPHIINMQILYGKDDDDDGSVDTYDNTTPASASDWAEVQSIKIALVSRSTQWEKALVSTGDGTISWSGSSLATLRIDKNPSGSANADWQHYRYKVFETVIPLRNMIWRQ